MEVAEQLRVERTGSILPPWIIAHLVGLPVGFALGLAGAMRGAGTVAAITVVWLTLGLCQALVLGLVVWHDRWLAWRWLAGSVVGSIVAGTSWRGWASRASFPTGCRCCSAHSAARSSAWGSGWRCTPVPAG